VRRLGDPPTGLFAAAGIDIGGPAHRLPVADWSRVLDVNLTGAYLAARTVIATMLDAGVGGSIVLCSSPAAFVAFAAGGTSAYAASKGGVAALVRALAIDYAGEGIRVNAIVPGPTETPLMWASVPDTERAALREQVCAEVPLGRIADPVEPARAALWLLGPDSAYVTGSQLVCDGGVLAKSSISI
jgi:NAD(P)-dependent dehydrogenase (short-subunit alcohol dehydrogenase family)